MDRDTARAALLLCALPSGFFGVLFGLRYDFESHVAGSTLIISSLASVVTLPVALVLTAGWGCPTPWRYSSPGRALSLPPPSTPSLTVHRPHPSSPRPSARW